jgi:aspartate 1-decarboxylase
MIKVLKSVLFLKGKFSVKEMLGDNSALVWDDNVTGLGRNEVVLGKVLMDALNIVEGEIVECSVSEHEDTFNAYISAGTDDEEILFGRSVSRGNVTITSYSYMNQDSAKNNKPIRVKMK